MCTKSELKIVLQEVENASKQLYGDKLNKIILYGSYARGDNTEESDIDIMIILDGDIDDVKKMRSLTAEMASNISIEQEVFLSIVLRDKKHFEDSLDFLPLPEYRKRGDNCLWMNEGRIYVIIVWKKPEDAWNLPGC